ncbi:DUF4395 domain-containing protein [Dactylosporangium vinaceum]|uniref:DUF4395 domain-containing protein n=1 Tax=Dactylosporangium vinaceum TaxID=53362 RepID=A0ABV5MNG9_9ACTN|nr:DUF4395 domain-containing protein [Dactylosporangium vinaceum]UAB95099.1 DUF4395 domain-containing protein [Dactylosporangium vinaceum]
MTTPAGLDPRGPRFAAVLTTIVFVIVLLTGSGWLALAQAVIFAFGAGNPRWNAFALVYRYLVAPRLAPPAEREDPAPVRFAQAVGLVFTVVAAAAYLGGATVLGTVFAAFALVAAFLNGFFGLCLGCEAYLLVRRLRAA